MQRHWFPKSKKSILRRALSTVFSGIQPTGIPHLGNYLGAISTWKQIQDSWPRSTRIIFCIVDLHAITTPHDRNELRRNRYDMLASLIACGIDPVRSIIFKQSDVMEHADLAWILNCHAPMGNLFRMTQWKSKVGKNAMERVLISDNAEEDDVTSMGMLGFFAYPVLQAADILIYKATHVPVGNDQYQHLELARTLARRFNKYYKVDTFPLPSTVPPFSRATTRIMSLRDASKKMSKSDPIPESRILLTDEDEDIAAKVRFAITDSFPGISYDPDTRPGVSNLLSIIASLEGNDIEQVQHHCQSMSMNAFKQYTTRVISSAITPIREQYHALMSSTNELDQILQNGGRAAREIANETRQAVHRSVGLS